MTTAASLYLANIPSPDRGVWELDLGFVTLPLRAYALCIIVGIVVAIWWGDKRFVARGGRAGDVVDIAVFAVPFGLVGGRLYHVATDYYRYFGAGKNPLNALKVWDGGLGIWGAVALGAVGAWIGCRRKGLPLTAFADALAAPLVTAQAIGRVGNYFNQELYGGSTNLPWGLEIYVRQPDMLTGVATPDHTQIPGSPFHPTFLYELLWNLLVAAFVVYMDRRFKLAHGRAFALYVAGYTLGRCWIELMRTDPATMVLGLRINVWTSIVMFIGALVYFYLARSRGGREDLVALRAEFEGTTVTAEKSAEPDDDAPEAKTDDEKAAADPDKADAEDKAEPVAKTADADTIVADGTEPEDEPEPVVETPPAGKAEPATETETKAVPATKVEPAAKAEPDTEPDATVVPATKVSPATKAEPDTTVEPEPKTKTETKTETDAEAESRK